MGIPRTAAPCRCQSMRRTRCRLRTYYARHVPCAVPSGIRKSHPPSCSTYSPFGRDHYGRGAVLLLVEPVVFHVGLNAVVFHEFVVLFAAVARVGTYLLGQLAPTRLVKGEEGRKGRRVHRVPVESEVGDVLILCSYLKIIAGLGLAVVHRVLLHAHERGVRVGLGVAVAGAHSVQLIFIFLQLLLMLLQIVHCLLALPRPFPCPPWSLGRAGCSPRSPCL